MGLERFEWRKFSVEDPQPVIESMATWGWKVHSIQNRERVIRSRHAGSSVHSEGLGSYSGTTSFDREYWVELTMVRDPRHPNYRELVDLERMWHSNQPGHRVVRPPDLGESRIVTFLGWSVLAFFGLAPVSAILRAALPQFVAWRENMGQFGFNLVYAGCCILIGLARATFAHHRPTSPGDDPLSEEEKRDWNRRGADWNKKRYAALNRAQEITWTRP